MQQVKVVGDKVADPQVRRRGRDVTLLCEMERGGLHWCNIGMCKARVQL